MDTTMIELKVERLENGYLLTTDTGIRFLAKDYAEIKGWVMRYTQPISPKELYEMPDTFYMVFCVSPEPIGNHINIPMEDIK